VKIEYTNAVEFIIRDDGKVLAYLQSENPEIWNWDENYYTLPEFLEKFKYYQKIDMTYTIKGEL
jgi:hypothetical protein